MAVLDPSLYVDETVTVFNPVGGTPAGSKCYLPVTVRGRLIEAGFQAASIVTSGITLAVAVGDQVSAIASTYSQVITSTIGTFSSAVLFEGAMARTIPTTQIYVRPGDSLQYTTSGGQSSTVGLTCYAVIRRA